VQHGYIDIQDAKFCSQCGALLQHACPTCGQEWNGKKTQLAPSDKAASSQSEPTKVKKSPESKKDVEPTRVAEGKKGNKSNIKDPEFAGLMYGIDYESGKDCTNCGSVGQSGRVCKLCGFEG
jgi:ribosomal protein L32